MVVSNLPAGQTTGKGKGKAKEILVDPASLQALMDGDKNVQVNAVVHPKLHGTLIAKLASNEANVVNEGGKQTLKRTAYSHALREAVAQWAGYQVTDSTPLVILGRQGGNVIGVASALNTVVGTLFSGMRSMGAITQMPEEQIKAFAFAQARENVSAHPQLSSIELTDELLDKLWSGAVLEDEDPEDEDEDEDESPA